VAVERLQVVHDRPTDRGPDAGDALPRESKTLMTGVTALGDGTLIAVEKPLRVDRATQETHRVREHLGR
jgi:hypothetical protein